MTFSEIFGKRKPCPIEQEATQAREANVKAADNLLAEIDELLKGPVAPVVPFAARRASQGRA